MINALTVDVEDYHNVNNRNWLGSNEPPTPAVVENTTRLLAIFAEFNVSATFFILGEVAATYPELIRTISTAGHELGIHGFYHRQVFKLSPKEFLKEVVDAKTLIEDVSGVSAPGHRAPAFSIFPATRWALDMLAEAGFGYDSSVFPISGRRYGWPGFPLDIQKIALHDGREIIEAPLTTAMFMGRRLPACGGGYMRHFPYAYTHWAMSKSQHHRPAIVYIHPYEIESGGAPLDPPGLSTGAARRLRRFHRLQLRNRSTMEGKLRRLLTDYKFEPLGRVIERRAREPGLNCSSIDALPGASPGRRVS